MIEAIILYGSRARRDSATGSDADLLGISANGRIEKTYEDQGVSFHVYPLAWMLTQAAKGSLFLLHINLEASAVFDPRSLLENIRKAFQYKESYLEDLEIGARVVMAMTRQAGKEFTPVQRTRYFWGLRTAIMAAAANEGTPVFSGRALEEFAKVDGLADHIHARGSASFGECRDFGRRVVENLTGAPPHILAQEPAENLRALLRFGGIAAVTAGSIVYGA
jgi:hypothetical protein